MAKVGYYKRYLYIIEKLTSVPSSFQELHKYVMTKLENDDLGGKFEYSNRTFDRDKTDIYDLFGILIQYDRKDKVYYIEDIIENSLVSRMIESFSIHQALKDGNKITPSIYLESRKSSGTHLLNAILYAIQNYFMVSFTHTKFWNMEITQRIVKPIAIKEAQHRWYLVAVDTKNSEIRNFGFDRITDFRILETKFKPLNCNIDEMYQHAFGIEKYEPAQKLILEFSWQQGNYIKSFPLHASQKIISDNEKGLVIELFIHPTNDIVMELLKYGAEVKVLEPVVLKNTLKKRISEMMKKYK